jgi:Protein of unknown function (DUF2950)
VTGRVLAAVSTAIVSSLLVSACGKRGAEQPAFETPEAAVDALVASTEKDDLAALGRLLGPETQDLLTSGDEVADRAEREGFVRRYHVRHRLVVGGPDNMVLQVGEDHWPLPLPLVRQEGKWRFDGAAGADELVVRRIGANELRTIDVMRGFVAAQQDYAAKGRDSAAAGVYASRFRSTAGKHDGLYWEVAADEPPSPAGPFLAAAAEEGYALEEVNVQTGKRTPYHGYVYRMLLSQGAAANGGAREYLVNGKLTGGFAMLAIPETYGASGVMSLIVNQDGVVWQRDLGEDTARVAAAIQQFDPDDTWTPIASEQ